MGIIGHPAYDIIYGTGINLDYAFRKEYEAEYMKTYFEAFSPYVIPFYPVTYESFMEELDYYRDAMVIGCFGVRI